MVKLMYSEEHAIELLENWPNKINIFGVNKLDDIVNEATKLGSSYYLVYGKSSDESGYKYSLDHALALKGLIKLGETTGSAPNSPIEDVVRVAHELNALVSRPDFVISIGGGSLIDAVKGSLVLTSCGGVIEDYFGVGKVTQAVTAQSKTLISHLAIMTSSASAAHLTKYSNITNLSTNQKKLIIDESIIPTVSCFDYAVTDSMNRDFTITGALDGLGHLVEVYLGFDESSEQFELVEDLVLTGFKMIVDALPITLARPGNITSRQQLGLATDLGGYAIMLGSTNGPHLNSFSLVDLMDHGQAVGILNPYYTYFFSNAVPLRVQKLNAILRNSGYGSDFCTDESVGSIYVRQMHGFMKKVGAATTLMEIEGFGRTHIERMLTAAKDPQLSVKLKAMPITMDCESVDVHMKSILNAASHGDVSKIITIEIDYTTR